MRAWAAGWVGVALVVACEGGADRVDTSRAGAGGVGGAATGGVGGSATGGVGGAATGGAGGAATGGVGGSAGSATGGTAGSPPDAGLDGAAATGGTAGAPPDAGTDGAAATGGSAGAPGDAATDGTPGDAATDGTPGDAADGAACVDAPPPVDAGCIVRICENGRIYQCGDCIDNDGDGRTDAEDAQCLGPCDNDEASLTMTIPGSSTAPCVSDCYFDGSTGSGNDGCWRDQDCDPLVPETGCEGRDAAALVCPALTPPACLDFCLPLTPNGCDCFGCCEARQEPGVFRWLGGPWQMCTLDAWSSCPLCTPVPSCFNACDACEHCLGDDPLVPRCPAACPDR